LVAKRIFFGGKDKRDNSVLNNDSLPDNTIPMYGFLSHEDYLLHRSAKQATVDDSFVDEIAGSDHEKAIEMSNYFVQKSFEYLNNDPEAVIRHFNQAWLIDSNNHSVYWGFAIYTANHENNESALKYFDMALEKFDQKYVQSVVSEDRLLCDAAIGYASAYEDGGRMNDTYLDKAKELVSEINAQNAPPHCLALINAFSQLSVHTLKVGDTVGDFTVASIRLSPFVYGDGSQDFTTEYSGATTISGEYYWSEMFDRVCFTPRKEDAPKIPRLEEDTRDAAFCFSNTPFAQKVFASTLVAGSSGDGVKYLATVTIQNYAEIFAHKEASDFAELMSAVLGEN